jgi:hypothetical protein
MAVREFNGTSDVIRMDGAYGAFNTATLGMSFVFVIKLLNVTGIRAVSSIGGSSGLTGLAGLYTNGTNTAFWGTDNPNADLGATVTVTTSVWGMFTMTKAAGTAIPQFGFKQLSSGSWSRAAASGSVAASDGTPATNWHFGTFTNGTSFHNMRLAVAGAWNRQLSTAEIDGMEISLSTRSMFNLRPVTLIEFNQPATTVKPNDIMEVALTQGVATGTTVVTGDDPTWEFGVNELDYNYSLFPKFRMRNMA